MTKNEILTALNRPEGFILAIVGIDGENRTTRYIPVPFPREPDFAVTSVNYSVSGLLEQSGEPA